MKKNVKKNKSLQLSYKNLSYARIFGDFFLSLICRATLDMPQFL